MAAKVAIVGNGMLAGLVCDSLSRRHELVHFSTFPAEAWDNVKLALVLQDDWQAAVNLQAEEILQTAGIPWISAFVLIDEGIIGPLVRPGAPGCSQCAEMRLFTAGHDRELPDEELQQAEYGGLPPNPWATRSGLWQMACLAAEEALKFLRGQPSGIENNILLVNLRTLAISRRFFLPDPLCTICGRVPEDSPDAARFALRPNPKRDADSFRCQPLAAFKQILPQDYLDARTGLINRKMLDPQAIFASVYMNVPIYAMNQVTAGRTHSFGDSELAAILEGLERYCGMEPRGKRTVIFDSLKNLADQALDPAKLGLHSPEQYGLPGFPFKPFTPDQSLEWVWGYSVLQERPVLVPKSIAYYGFDQEFVFESSNGCAIGGSLEEAVFYGILEVVERDAYLITWHARLSVPYLDPTSVDDKELRLMIDRLQTIAGYDVHICNTTMEHGIPSVWVVGKNRNTTGAHLICTAGAHPDPVRAAKSALHELAGMIPMLSEQLANNGEEILRMLDDSSRVVRMEDHALLYTLPEAQERLQFLLDNPRPLQTFAEGFNWKVKHRDLTDDLKELLRRLRQSQLDVIVVDQTAPEIARNGLHCVKVIIPGLLPMTFGHHFTRLTGLDRVLKVPVELGYSKAPLTPDQLNPYPHPFP